MSGLDPVAFGEFFDGARRTMFRWEGQRVYRVSADDTSIKAFREGTPRPERSVTTDPWVARIARQSLREDTPVLWQRVRLIDGPMTEYDRWSLLAYAETQAAGERVLVASERMIDGPDFWLRDPGEPSAAAVLMHYTDDGAVAEREPVYDPAVIADLHARSEVALAAAVPLNVWLAQSSA